MNEVMTDLKLNIASLLCEVEGMFKEPVYVTCIVRNTNRENANVITTNDPDLPRVIDVINGEGIEQEEVA